MTPSSIFDVLSPTDRDDDSFLVPDDALQFITPTSRQVKLRLHHLSKDISLMKYVLFTNVPPHVAELSFGKCIRQMYDPSTRRLLLKLVRPPHEGIVRSFKWGLVAELERANLTRLLEPIGAGRFKGSVCLKEPDRA